MTAARLTVEQGTAWHGLTAHGLQAQRLCAQLHLVGAMCLGATPLVFDRKSLLAALRLAKLDHVGHACQTKLGMGQRQRADTAHPRPPLCAPRIHPLMQDPPLSGLRVLDPQLLQMDQCALPRAVQVVLQGGEGNGVHVQHGANMPGIRQPQSISCTFTPLGTAAACTSTW